MTVRPRCSQRLYNLQRQTNSTRSLSEFWGFRRAAWSQEPTDICVHSLRSVCVVQGCTVCFAAASASWQHNQQSGRLPRLHTPEQTCRSQPTDTVQQVCPCHFSSSRILSLDCIYSTSQCLMSALLAACIDHLLCNVGSSHRLLHV